jgi:hypothetical protein
MKTSETKKLVNIFASGLKLNLSKTEILAFNTDSNLLQEIAARYGIKIVDSLTYLGIEITGDFGENNRASNHKAVGKIGENVIKSSTLMFPCFIRIF